MPPNSAFGKYRQSVLYHLTKTLHYSKPQAAALFDNHRIEFREMMDSDLYAREAAEVIVRKENAQS